MSEFEVGQVARAEFRDGSGGENAILTVSGWVAARGPIDRRAEAAFNFVPLAVIDPDGGDPDTLYDLYVQTTGVMEVDRNRSGLRESLRKYANPEPPAPPKPDEPLRLGATVRDRDGLVWLRVGRGGHLPGARVWAPVGEITNGLRWRAYADIDVVEIDVEDIEVIEREQG